MGAAGASEPWRGDRGAESGHGGASVKQGVVGGAVEVTRSAQVAAVTVGNESTSARDAETRGTQRQAGSTGERQAGTQSSVVSARERGPDRPGGAAMAEGGSEGFGAHAASAFASVGDATGAEAPVQPEVDPWDAAAARVWMRETCGASVDVGSFAAEAEAVEQVAAALVAARRVDAALGPLCPAGEDGHGSDLAQGLLEMEQDLLGQAEGEAAGRACLHVGVVAPCIWATVLRSGFRCRPGAREGGRGRAAAGPQAVGVLPRQRRRGRVPGDGVCFGGG